MTVLTSYVKTFFVVYSLLSAWPLSVSEAERIPSLTEKRLRLVPFLVPQAVVLVPIQVLLLASFLSGSIPQWAWKLLVAQPILIPSLLDSILSQPSASSPDTWSTLKWQVKLHKGWKYHTKSHLCQFFLTDMTLKGDKEQCTIESANIGVRMEGHTHDFHSGNQVSPEPSWTEPCRFCAQTPPKI